MSLTAEFLEQVRESSSKAFPFIERCGVKTEEVKPGYCRMIMPLEGNKNHIGTMYAGALFTLAELPGGVVYLTSFDTNHFYPIIKSMNIRFRRPAMGDISVEATLDLSEANEISEAAEKDGKCDYGWVLDLTDASGEVVAIAECLYQLRRVGK